MAKKEIIQIIDDIDGAVLDDYETIRWSVDGKSYEFDTSPEHADEFRKAIEPYLSVSRVISGRTAPVKRVTTGTRSKEQTQAIRDWANKNGYTVSDRGRIPLHVIEAFEAAH